MTIGDCHIIQKRDLLDMLAHVADWGHVVVVCKGEKMPIARVEGSSANATIVVHRDERVSALEIELEDTEEALEKSKALLLKIRGIIGAGADNALQEIREALED